jgi:hypothetical protein
MNRLTIQVPVYQFKCVVVIDKEIETRINAFVKRHKWSEDHLIKDGDQVHGYALNPGLVHTYYIFYSEESVTPNILTHEVSHLVDYVMGDKGMADSETRAYLSGFINEKIFDYVLKNKLLINKWLTKEKLNKDLLEKTDGFSHSLQDKS